MTSKFVIGTSLVCLLAGCATSVAPSLPPTPLTADLSESPVPAETSATPMASHRPSDSPEQAPTPDVPATLGPDAVAEVVTSDLVVRSEPAISDTSTIYPDSLDAPMLLYVVDGPVAANGYDWYLVKPFHLDYLPHGDELVIDPLIGWVAASGRDGEAWIEPARIDCPTPDLDGVRHLSPTGRLACFGDQELELAGELGGCFAGDFGTTSPSWLFHDACALVPPGYRAGVAVPDPGGLPLRDRGVYLPYATQGAPIVVTGHFDDPVATTCSHSPAASVVDPRPPVLIVLQCRTQFVVTGILSSR